VFFLSRSMFPPDFRWTDPYTWPWVVWVWACSLLLGWIAPLWKWLQRDRLKSWPTANGFVESIGEPEPRKFPGFTILPGSSHRSLEIRYSYFVLGQLFRGRHTLDSSSKCGLDEFGNRFIRLPVQVNYHPEKPAVSALLDSSIEALLRQAPPLSAQDEQRMRAAHEIPAIYRPWLQPLMYLALTGFLISLWINIACLLGKQVLSDAQFFLMHGGVFAVFFPAFFAARKMLGDTNRRGFWKAVTMDTPKGLRDLFYLVFAYGWLTGAYGFFHLSPGNGQPSTLFNGSDLLPFSGVWMVFYYSSFVILLSARNVCLKSTTAR
jgi:hypothetical protein